jgi:hypothetical protein
VRHGQDQVVGPEAAQGRAAEFEGFIREGEPKLRRALVAAYGFEATLLRLLSPAADFRDAGTDVIGGTRLTHLHATRLRGLPEDPTLARYANLTANLKSATVPPGSLTALDVCVDAMTWCAR